MGEEVKQEEDKAVEVKKEEKMEEKKEEAQPVPNPLVLFVDLHCMGCAKKIEKSILEIRGVEGIVIDMEKNEVSIKGVVDAQAICNKIMKKTKRGVKVLSPLPETKAEPQPEVVASQASELTILELNVNMHCLACAQQLRRKIFKLKGVQTVEIEFNSGKVKVTGTTDAKELVEYVYKSTKKQAKIVPQPEPEEKKEEEKPVEEGKKEDKTEGSREENDGKKKEKDIKEGENRNFSDDQSVHKLVHYYQSLYVIERIPPPQLFSDENPNACCIT